MIELYVADVWYSPQCCSASHMPVSFSGRAFGFVDQALATMGHKRRVVLTVNPICSAAKVVIQSDLRAVLPRHVLALAGYADELVMRELPLAMPSIQVDALWHQRLQSSDAHRRLHQSSLRAWVHW